MTTSPYSIAIDIGGTFTDIVLMDQSRGELAVAKVLTSYPDPSKAVLVGVRDLLIGRGIQPKAVGRVIHGTTLVTNTLIERKGAHTALLTTEGFRDALEIGREGRYDIYDLGLVLPEPLVERRLRLEVGERMDARGEVLLPLDETTVQEWCRLLQGAGVEAIAITFLHSYANPAHERRAADIVREFLPRVPVSLSQEVAPELREYERTSTTVANAYVQPITGRYLHGLETGLQTANVNAPLHIMLSNAGTCSVDTAAAFPVRLVESGPAGGALAGAYWGQQLGYEDVVAFDMGGTTAKAILSSQGEFPITTKAEVARVHRFKRGSGLPLLVPMLDMIEIGAGGGSIAHLNELGLPVVGPQSAGATPGPACYAQGGTQPTVTDADLILGYLNQDYFVGGAMRLDVDNARAAVQCLADSLDMEVARMAWGVHQLVNENMAGAARMHAAERGLDIRAYAMVATGGAGPSHACGVAERLGVKTVVVPPGAGVGSAFGLLLAPISFDFSRTHVAHLEELDLQYLNNLLNDMEAEGREIVSEAGVGESDISVSRTADMRYVGQGFEIRVPIESGHLQDSHRQKFQEAFERVYIRIYNRLCVGVPTQVVNWRVTVSGPRPDLRSVRIASVDTEKMGNVLKGTRLTLFDPNTEPAEVSVYSRYALSGGFEITGPAIIEEAESTTIVSPGWSTKLDESGCLILSSVE